MKKTIILLTAIALSACSSLKTNSDYDPEINFDNLKTYAWIVKQTDKPSYQLNSLLDGRVRASVDKQLQLKGLSKTDTNDADILINYLTQIDKKVNIDTFNSSFGYSPYYGAGWRRGGSIQTHTTVNEYEVGTLVLDIVDRQSNRLIWRGSVADTIREKNTPEERMNSINAAVIEMLKQYPPNPEER
ncbi:DUF4136 domain-containing protein [Alkalimarinus alittae]|uniref:DUF4136 domain-containing protein n=1 Tax=Alkalimarinus alittae TaxID=2961619 RepID=A0ABY6N4L9_9ALTE|nr:DUF4136 domain-containing protein [Alkalimarinus alittae]UZE97076.1 DUF4136 domain-containing protein [Alkalimarinus alittae]